MATFTGNIYWDGKNPKIQGRDKFIEWLSQYPEDQWLSFTVEPRGSINDSNQRRLYHKWCDILYDEFGWDSSAEMHEFFKERFNNGQSTKGFDQEQWSKYMTKVAAFANENNINLPNGDDS
jgi:hypothetical protein